MDRLNIDTIGPLPPDEQGYKHIIVIIDSFTRFIELYKARSTTAIAAAEAILQHIGRYGNPLEILTDRGTQYKNEIVATLTHELGIESTYTAPYSHEENGIFERSNKEVMRHLRAIIFDSKIINSWSKGLPIVQRIMNTQVHSSLGVSPAQLLFGNALRVDRDMFQVRDATPNHPRSKQQYVDVIGHDPPLPPSQFVKLKKNQMRFLVKYYRLR
jgi:transposase InsO family protein